MGRIKVGGQPEQKLLSNQPLGMMVHACHPSYMGSINRKMVV
jgi:hypothetical protein